MNILYPLAVATNRESDIKEALKYAISNDAKKIKLNFSQLPEHWIYPNNNLS